MLHPKSYQPPPVPWPARAPTQAPNPAPTFDPGGARSECEEKGGTVEERRAAWNTNGDLSNWVLLNNGIELCRFQTLGPDDDSRIYVDMRTLTAHEPTLAAVANLSRVPFRERAPHREPRDRVLCVRARRRPRPRPGLSAGRPVATDLRIGLGAAREPMAGRGAAGACSLVERSRPVLNVRWPVRVRSTTQPRGGSGSVR